MAPAPIGPPAGRRRRPATARRRVSKTQPRALLPPPAATRARGLPASWHQLPQARGGSAPPGRLRRSGGHSRKPQSQDRSIAETTRRRAPAAPVAAPRSRPPSSRVIANSIATEGPTPRAAEAAATTRSPTRQARRAPSRAINSEPGTAARPNSRTGNPDRTPTAFSLSSNCRWISGSTGGTASTVTRSAPPASHKTASRDSEAGNIFSEVKTSRMISCDRSATHADHRRLSVAAGCAVALLLII